jgi:hypothetical protein
MTDLRHDVVQAGVDLYEAKHNIHYKQLRPVPYSDPPKFPLFIDCSGFVGMCFYLAGANDPAGFDFNGRTDVATLIARGLHISRQALVAGDVVCYGANDHTALVVKVFTNGDVLTLSQGQDGDPSYVWCGKPKGPAKGYPADTRTPVTYLRFPTRPRDVKAKAK